MTLRRGLTLFEASTKSVQFNLSRRFYAANLTHKNVGMLPDPPLWPGATSPGPRSLLGREEAEQPRFDTPRSVRALQIAPCASIHMSEGRLGVRCAEVQGKWHGSGGP